MDTHRQKALLPQFPVLRPAGRNVAQADENESREGDHEYYGHFSNSHFTIGLATLFPSVAP
jgi:hypothetical protein